MKPTFLNQSKPILTSMIQSRTPEECIAVIKNSIYDGAEAFGLQMCKLGNQYKDEATLKRIFSSMAGRPAYITNYRISENNGKSDGELMEMLVSALECGGTLADIMGDTFAPEYEISNNTRSKVPDELTMDKNAVNKQMELIERIHSMGKEVLMSSHVLRFIPAERVVEIALEHEKRGADIAKIVTAANNEDEEFENLRITKLLKKELKIPFLFLTGGSHYKFQRMIGPMFGSVMYLCVQHHDTMSTVSQPILKSAKLVRDNFDYLPDIIY